MPSRSRSVESPRSTRISSPELSVGDIESPSTRTTDRLAGEVPVRASHIPRERWVDALVRCPGDRFQIVATDEDPATWFAFREPLEMPMGSALVESLIGSSSVLLFGALLLAFFTARLT